MNRIRSQKGAISIGGIILILILLVGGYVGLKMGVPLVRFFQVKEVFRNEVARLKTDSEKNVRETVLKRISEFGIVFKEDRDFEDGLIIITENEYGEKIPAIMEARYDVVVNFVGGYKHIYHFNPRKVSKQ